MTFMYSHRPVDQAEHDKGTRWAPCQNMKEDKQNIYKRGGAWKMFSEKASVPLVSVTIYLR